MTKQRKIYTKSKIQKLIAKSQQGKYYVADNFFLEITKSGKAIWKTRFRLHGKAYEKTVGTYGENNAYFMSFEDAIKKAGGFRKSLNKKLHPIECPHTQIETVDDLVTQFFENRKYKYTREKKVYEEIKPILGNKLVREVTSIDLETIIKNIVDSGRTSIAVIAIGLLRNVFDYADIHNLTIENVAAHLDKKHHAGQKDSNSTVTLQKSQIKKVFQVFQQFPMQAKLTNQCAIALYLIFGMRKSELLRAKWVDFDEEELELIVRPTKKGNEQLAITVPKSVLPVFRYLKQMANSSPFIFPTINGSSSGHLSESTLNAMIKVFFTSHKTRKVEFDNPLGNLNIPKFSVHDLRRTFTTIAADYKVNSNVIELGLNHLKRKSIRPYEHSSRPSEREEMYELMAGLILPLTNLIPVLEQQVQEDVATSLPLVA